MSSGPRTRGDIQLINDYIFFHMYNPLTTNPDDYKHFNEVLFRAIKLNAAFSAGIGVAYFALLFNKRRGILRDFFPRGLGAAFLTMYALRQFKVRFDNCLYTEESLKLAKKYEAQIDEYNDHFRRVHGNK